MLYDNSGEFYRASNGEPIGYFWGYKTAGVFQNQQEIKDWIAAGNGVLQADVQPGDVKYYDVNHDGVINDSDKVNLGNGMPKFTYGFTLGFDYKGFDFSLKANGQAGNKIVQSYRNVGSTTANYTTAILISSLIFLYRMVTSCALVTLRWAMTSRNCFVRSGSRRLVSISRFRISIPLLSMTAWILKSVMVMQVGFQVSTTDIIRVLVPSCSV